MSIMILVNQHEWLKTIEFYLLVQLNLSSCGSTGLVEPLAETLHFLARSDLRLSALVRACLLVSSSSSISSFLPCSSLMLFWTSPTRDCSPQALIQATRSRPLSHDGRLQFLFWTVNVSNGLRQPWFFLPSQQKTQVFPRYFSASA